MPPGNSGASAKTWSGGGSPGVRPLPQRLVELRRTQQDIPQPTAHLGGTQRLLAHGAVRREGIHDGIHQLAGQIGRIGKLFLGVVGRLLLQGLGCQELALDDMVDIDQPVILGQVALEQVVDLGDNLVEAGLFLLLHRAATGLAQRRQLPVPPPPSGSIRCP